MSLHQTSSDLGPESVARDAILKVQSALGLVRGTPTDDGSGFNSLGSMISLV